jgi:hypothetical protein
VAGPPTQALLRGTASRPGLGRQGLNPQRLDGGGRANPHH